MKNNVLKNKIKNCNYNFSKNLFYHFIVPCVAILVGIILLFTIGFNKGLDFEGGISATVVVQELKQDNKYNEAKEQLDKVLKDFKINGEVYQVVETNYYGDAISVKFDKPFENKEKLDEFMVEFRDALEQSFYPSLTDETELDNFVKVNEFEGSVSKAFIYSSILAVFIAILCVVVYLSARYGLSAGMTTLCVAAIDLLVMLALTVVCRVKIESTVVIPAVFTCLYSVVASTIFFARIKENLAKEKYAKASNQVIANQSVKDVMFKNTILAVLFLVSSLLLGVIPTYMVRRMSIPMMLGCFSVYYSSMLITPGLWAFTHIRKARKNKEKEQKPEVNKEEKYELEDTPEVIVETEAKEEN